ncbi:uroporphyrinogen-III C-methyltransferase [Affinibrenneria salicis]|uniref:Uroporphyrinogen-III C-methyltransferase n=1 Tax=Affinibrenneria salicis TaxID=2590031 RepID=A0A5J5FSM4_9GAMM|nr:uroporphyrinogen-III C-methyltransferase [Affinibrenneria salicis]KAA8996440.1 uroporphyrinogen-III C-methyltransferase [Affinibrenneria salicis]
MTEQHTPSPPLSEEGTDAAQQQEKSATTGTPTKEKRSGAGTALGIVAILIALALGGGLYYHGHQQAQSQAETIAGLQSQLSSLRQNQQQAQENWQTQQQQQSTAQAETGRRINDLTRQSEELSNKLATLSSHENKTWMLAQADFLVRLAGRKLWSDRDVTTAAALLKSADASLADMDDPSLIEVRRALTHDINTLSSVSQIDFDGIILKVNELSNNVDNLRLADNDSDEAPMDEHSSELSASLSEWRQNLSKSWHNFMADFITIQRRNDTAEPLLAPNQDIYLRENIRSRLLIAAQAVPRHQNEVYRQSLETVSTWVRAWFDTSDASTKAFLDQLDELSQQSVALDVPTELQSQPLLEKLMQTRVRNLLAAAPHNPQEG